MEISFVFVKISLSGPKWLSHQPEDWYCCNCSILSPSYLQARRQVIKLAASVPGNVHIQMLNSVVHIFQPTADKSLSVTGLTAAVTGVNMMSRGLALSFKCFFCFNCKISLKNTFEKKYFRLDLWVRNGRTCVIAVGLRWTEGLQGQICLQWLFAQWIFLFHERN